METLGLLQPLSDAGVASDAAVLHKAVQWCEDNGATALGDITSTGMVDDFVRSLGLKPIPSKKLIAAAAGAECVERSCAHARWR